MYLEMFIVFLVYCVGSFMHLATQHLFAKLRVA